MPVEPVFPLDIGHLTWFSGRVGPSSNNPGDTLRFPRMPGFGLRSVKTRAEDTMRGLARRLRAAPSAVLVVLAITAAAARAQTPEFFKNRPLRRGGVQRRRVDLRHLCAAAGPAHRRTHSGQARRRRTEYARRRWPQGRGISLPDRAARRHRDRHNRPRSRLRADAGRKSGRGGAAQVHLDREHEPRRQPGAVVARLDDQDVRGSQAPRTARSRHRCRR